jgi:hypothetical protein
MVYLDMRDQWMHRDHLNSRKARDSRVCLLTLENKKGSGVFVGRENKKGGNKKGSGVFVGRTCGDAKSVLSNHLIPIGVNKV